MSDLLTVERVAQRFGVLPVTVRRWAKDGKLPAITLPSGRLRFRAEDIDAFFAPTESAS